MSANVVNKTEITKLSVLKQCTTQGNVIRLPFIQLDRKLYLEVKKALELIGGKWKGGKVAGFVFATDPTELLEEIATGENRNLKKEFQFFETPPELARRLVELADVQFDDKVLEPSAGQGAIIHAINHYGKVGPDCYELMDVNRIVLEKRMELKFNLLGEDFFKHKGKKYNVIIANPPFSKNQDIDHLMEMYECLEEGGRLVCITGESWTFGSQKKQVAFREFLKENEAETYPIDRDTFKASGTSVGGRIIVMEKY